ncbi:MAG: phosphatidylinositol mannoside acyltransferase [Acidimicrobiia bacterium]|nr:phosphatidylinositol mannoside acyltransferase [Acidimicrobiia bacterium]
MKDYLAYLGFRVATGLFGLLPESWIRRIGERGGEIASRRFRGSAPLLRSHLRRAMGPLVDDADLDRGVVDMYRYYGRYWTETFWFRPRRRPEILRNIERVNFEPVYRSIEAGHPRIFALPHLGNWEVAGMIAEEIGTPVVAVAEHLPNEHITDWFIDIRNRFGIQIILTSDPSRTRKLIKVLKDGGAIALVADRDVTGRGLPVTFFGEETSLPGGPVALADATGADLFPIGAYFHEGRGHRIVVHDPIALPDLPTREERVAVGAQEFAEVLEDIIREAPSQWHLFQPNWPSDRSLVEEGS